MAKDNTNILLLAGAGIGAYYLYTSGLLASWFPSLFGASTTSAVTGADPLAGCTSIAPGTLTVAQIQALIAAAQAANSPSQANCLSYLTSLSPLTTSPSAASQTTPASAVTPPAVQPTAALNPTNTPAGLFTQVGTGGSVMTPTNSLAAPTASTSLIAALQQAAGGASVMLTPGQWDAVIQQIAPSSQIASLSLFDPNTNTPVSASTYVFLRSEARLPTPTGFSGIGQCPNLQDFPEYPVGYALANWLPYDWVHGPLP